MTSSFYFKCTSCGNALESGVHPLSCPTCHSALDVIYDYESLRNKFKGIPKDSEREGVWKFSPVLPLTPRTLPISLGEANSPLIRAKSIGSDLGIAELYVKDESRNPTLSFKDRKSALIVAKGLEDGYAGVACETAGNAGSSLAAYAKKAGITAYVFVSEGISTSKLAKLLSFNPRVFMTSGPSSKIFEFLLSFCERYRILNGTSASRYNPYVKEGGKTAVFEIWEQLGGRLPDWIVVPVGGGGNLCSYYKGMTELRELGLIERYSRLVGVQGRYCAPVVEAFEKGLNGGELPRIDNPHTIAHSIQDDWAPDGVQALNAIRVTRGCAVSVSDDEILDASKVLSSKEYIFAEPASAAPLAAVKNLLAKGTVLKEESILVVSTGNGLNQPDAAIRAWGSPPTVELSLERMRDYVE